MQKTNLDRFLTASLHTITFDVHLHLHIKTNVMFNATSA